MGRYVKVYLNEQQEKGMEILRKRLEEERGEEIATNALINEALRNELFERGIFYTETMGNKEFTKVVKE